MTAQQLQQPAQVPENRDLGPFSIPAVGSFEGDSTALLGRRSECQVLDRVLGAAHAGHGGTIVVCGEPGIGKSTLLDYANGFGGRISSAPRCR